MKNQIFTKTKDLSFARDQNTLQIFVSFLSFSEQRTVSNKTENAFSPTLPAMLFDREKKLQNATEN